MELDFKECPECAAKPGSPVLCAACLHNREVISQLQAAIEDLQGTSPKTLPCGHPVRCLSDDEEPDDRYCRWCDEVDRLQQDGRSLRAQLEAKAVIVNDGVCNIDGNVGYLAIHGGAVHIKSMTCTDVSVTGAH